jgi:morphogenetic protein associated with SpoVID
MPIARIKCTVVPCRIQRGAKEELDLKIHIVKKGDTLYDLAHKYKVDLDKLIAMNPQLENPDNLDLGMKIKIPGPPMPPEPSGFAIAHKHVVVQGDSLWKLAKAWGIPLKTMIDVNPHLKNPNILMTGDVIYIPKMIEGNIAPNEANVPHGKANTAPMEMHPSPHGKANTAPMEMEQLPHGKANTAPIAVPHVYEEMLQQPVTINMEINVTDTYELPVMPNVEHIAQVPPAQPAPVPVIHAEMVPEKTAPVEQAPESPSAPYTYEPMQSAPVYYEPCPPYEPVQTAPSAVLPAQEPPCPPVEIYTHHLFAQYHVPAAEVMGVPHMPGVYPGPVADQPWQGAAAPWHGGVPAGQGSPWTGAGMMAPVQGGMPEAGAPYGAYPHMYGAHPPMAGMYGGAPMLAKPDKDCGCGCGGSASAGLGSMLGAGMPYAHAAGHPHGIGYPAGPMPGYPADAIPYGGMMGPAPQPGYYGAPAPGFADMQLHEAGNSAGYPGMMAPFAAQPGAGPAYPYAHEPYPGVSGFPAAQMHPAYGYAPGAGHHDCGCGGKGRAQETASVESVSSEVGGEERSKPASRSTKSGKRKGKVILHSFEAHHAKPAKEARENLPWINV